MRMLAFAAFAVSGLALSDVPRFAPEDKSSVEKTIRSEIKFAATEFKMSVGDQEIPKEALGEVILKFEEVTKLVITDRYVKSKDGRPLELERTFDELAQNKHDTQRMPGQPEAKEDEKTLESALESKTVRFTWDPQAEKYDLKLTEEGDDKLLEGLIEDLDFRGFLPKEDAKVGATWKLDGKSFNHLLDVGGDLKFDDDEEKPDDDEDFSKQINENISGEAEVKFEEVREKDGKRLAVITFRADLKSHAKVAQKSMDAEVKLEPEGELLWDLELNRIHALEVHGPMSISMKGDQEIQGGGDNHKLHIEIALEGTMAIEVSTR